MTATLIEKLQSLRPSVPSLEELEADTEFIQSLRSAYGNGYSVQELAHTVSPPLRAVGYPKITAHHIAAWLGVAITTIDRTRV